MYISIQDNIYIMLIEIKSKEMITLYDNQIIHIGDCFLRLNEGIINLSLNNVTTIGNDFLINNYRLASLSLDNVKHIGSWFLPFSKVLKSISLNSVVDIGDCFLRDNPNQNKNGEGINNIELYVH